MPLDWNVMPLSFDDRMSLGCDVSAVAIHTSPFGPMSIASTQILVVAVVKLHPPSRDTRRPWYVVAKIVPSCAMRYFGSNVPPYPTLFSHTQLNVQPSSWLISRPNVVATYSECGSPGRKWIPLVIGGRPLACATDAASRT